MADIYLFSVFVDEIMFHSFFKLNPKLWPFSVHGVDNREQNLGLPMLYNAIIEEYIDQDTWLYFVHEDFEIRGDLRPLLDLPPDAVYGSFGVRLEGHVPIGYGAHTGSHKDGAGAIRIGLPVTGVTEVDSLDCQSILLHTSLLRQYPQLRFDEHLSFDLYAEDLCLQAKFREGVPVRVFNLDFQHYSLGKIGDRYRQGLKYLAKKFPDNAIPGACSFVGGAAGELEKYFKYDVSAGIV